MNEFRQKSWSVPNFCFGLNGSCSIESLYSLLKPVENGAVRQHIEISADAGYTWETTFDAIYRRASAD